MARPKSKVLKSEIVRVRYTSAEKRIIKSFSDSCNKSMAEFIRHRSFDFRIVPRLKEDEISILKDLTAISNNLNQLTRGVHLGQALHSEVVAIINQINDQLKKLK